METDTLNQLIQHLELAPPAPASLLSSVQAQLGISFPPHYAAFMARHNGAEGPIGENAYLQLWALEELVPCNKDYAVGEFAPGLVLFGSNGGNTAYAFDTRVVHLPIVEVPFIGMSLDEATRLGDTFEAFLSHLASL